jgi:hypothetical protein
MFAPQSAGGSSFEPGFLTTDQLFVDSDQSVIRLFFCPTTEIVANDTKKALETPQNLP